MDAFEFFNNPIVPNVGMDMQYATPFVCDMDWMDMQYQSFCNGDDLYQMNQQIISDPCFQTLPQPHYDADPMGGVIVTDIFGGQHHYSSMEEAMMMTDVFSGDMIRVDTSYTDMLREKNEEYDMLVSERDAAVAKYHDAMSRRDLDEALRWEREANERQSWIQTKFNTPQYVPGLVRAPGLD